MYYITRCPQCNKEVHIHIKSYGLKVKGCKHIEDYKWRIPAKDRERMIDTPRQIQARNSKINQTKIYNMFKQRVGVIEK